MSRCYATVETKTKFTIQLYQCAKTAVKSVEYKDSISGKIKTQKLCNFHTKALERRLKKFEERFNFNSELKIENLN